MAVEANYNNKINTENAVSQLIMSIGQIIEMHYITQKGSVRSTKVASFVSAGLTVPSCEEPSRSWHMKESHSYHKI